MSERTLTLTSGDISRIRASNAVVVSDSDGATVAVFPEFTAFLELPPADRRLCLRDREIDEISRGESWTVSSVGDRTYCWTVRSLIGDPQ